jgi:microcystin degradation protein MlrC
MMRVAIGEFSHESNSFCAHETEIAQFEERELLGPDEMMAARADTGTVVGGFFAGGREAGMNLIPTIAASATPSGTVSAEAYRTILSRMIDAVRGAGKLDGILLSLHGAMVAAPVRDAEADILREVRQAAPGVPIVVVLDLHANVTPDMVERADVILGYNEEPHVDAYERGIEAAQVLARLIAGEIRPVTTHLQLPLILPAINMATERGPMRVLAEQRAELEGRTGVINISIFGGFYGSDQLEAGPSIIATTDGDEMLARELATSLARRFWETRHEFLVPLIRIPDAIRSALGRPGCTGLIDECDDPAGGGSCDGTAILQGLLDAGVSNAGIATIHDPEIVAQSLHAGLHGEVSGALGAKTDRLHGDPVQVTGRVKLIHQGPLSMRPWSNLQEDVGTMVVLDIDGIDVIVTEQKVVSEDVDLFGLLGIDSSMKKMLGLKGLGLHLRRAYGNTITEYIPVAGKGVTNPDVTALPYRHIRRPVYPLDDVPTWTP